MHRVNIRISTIQYIRNKGNYEMKNEKKTDMERQTAFDSLPPNIRENMTDEEKQLFLQAEEWPESLFDKLDEFIVKD
jgi:hypothetical protein